MHFRSSVSQAKDGAINPPPHPGLSLDETKMSSAAASGLAFRTLGRGIQQTLEELSIFLSGATPGFLKKPWFLKLYQYHLVNSSSLRIHSLASTPLPPSTRLAFESSIPPPTCLHVEVAQNTVVLALKRGRGKTICSLRSLGGK